MTLKLIHIARLFLLTLSLGLLFFWMGCIMNLENYKQKVAMALKAGDLYEAMKTLYQEQQQNHVALFQDPLFYMAKASVHLKNGNADAASVNINKAIELLGK